MSSRQGVLGRLGSLPGWLVVAAVTAAVLGVSLVSASAEEDKFRAQGKVRVMPLVDPDGDAVVAQTNLGNEAQLLRSEEVASQVADRLAPAANLPPFAADPAALADMVRVDFIDGTDFLVVSAQSTSLSFAQGLVDLFIDTYISVRGSQAVQTANRLETQYRGELSILEDEISLAVGKLVQLSEDDPSRPGREDDLEAMRDRANELRRLVVALQDTDSIRSGAASWASEVRLSQASSRDYLDNAIYGLIFGALAGLIALAVIRSLGSPETPGGSGDPDTAVPPAPHDPYAAEREPSGV